MLRSPEWHLPRHWGISVLELTPRLQHAAFSPVSHPRTAGLGHLHSALRLRLNLIPCKKDEEKIKERKKNKEVKRGEIKKN